MKVSAIVAAAGAGLRLKETSSRPLHLPKALWPLAHKPLLNHSLEALLESPQISEIILVLPPRRSGKMKLHKKIKVVSGDSSRALSVYRGLKRVSPSSVFVLVHDAARPLITSESIKKVIGAAKKFGAAIAAKPVSSTVKESEATRILRTIPRENLWEAQTPQVAKKQWLKQAYRSYFKNPFPATDEASLLEAIGKPVRLVLLDHPNLKITTGQDLDLAQKMLNGNSQFRIGQGSDIHRLIEGRPFMLGGEKLKWHLGPLGHSDGDALLHALSDAILGAIGKGDIGEYFSDSNKRFKNIPSSKILSRVLELAQNDGWQIENADCIVHLEKPRLGIYKLKIRKRVARLLNLDPTAINIKAKTQEGLGPIGSGGAVACEAVVLMKKVNA